jgi:hypothetical protein
MSMAPARRIIAKRASRLAVGESAGALRPGMLRRSVCRVGRWCPVGPEAGALLRLPLGLFLERTDERDEVVEVRVAQPGDRCHQRRPAVGHRALADHVLEIGVGSGLAVCVRVELEIADREIARCRLACCRQGDTRRAIALACGSVAGGAELLELCVAATSAAKETLGRLIRAVIRIKVVEIRVMGFSSTRFVNRFFWDSSFHSSRS